MAELSFAPFLYNNSSCGTGRWVARRSAITIAAPRMWPQIHTCRNRFSIYDQQTQRGAIVGLYGSSGSARYRALYNLFGLPSWHAAIDETILCPYSFTCKEA